MKIVFHGDRNSRIIKFGKFARRLLGKRRVSIDLWDGYKGHIYIERKATK